MSTTNYDHYDQYLNHYADRTTRTAFRQRYELGAVLGTGKDATVSKAKHVSTRRTVAVKTIRKSHLCTPENVPPHGRTRWTRLAREILIHKCHRVRRHRNIAQFHEALHDESNVYIVMDYCRGVTLERRLESRDYRITQLTLLSILQQLFDVLDWLHSRGIAHADLGLSNIMLVGDQIKLIDFGWARATNMEYVMNGSSEHAIQDNSFKAIDFTAATTLIEETAADIILSGRIPQEAQVTASIATLRVGLENSNVSARQGLDHVRQMPRTLSLEAIAPR